MIMYPLVCYYDGTCVIYGCFNVLPDRASSRSASIVVPTKNVEAIDQNKSKSLHLVLLKDFSFSKSYSKKH